MQNTSIILICIFVFCVCTVLSPCAGRGKPPQAHQQHAEKLNITMTQGKKQVEGRWISRAGGSLEQIKK